MIVVESGQDGNSEHAKPSAKRAGEKLSKENNYNINDPSEVAIIQTAIHYHEYREENPGQVDVDKIKKLAEFYAKENGVEQIDLAKTTKICELLKDADALDRFRFAKSGKLKKEFLRSETAKKEDVIEYAKNINEQIAKRILTSAYEVDEEEIELENAVQMLREMRIKKQTDEPHLDLKDIYTLPFPEEPIYDANRDFLELYFKKGVDVDQVNNVKSEIKKELSLSKVKGDNIKTKND